MQAQNIAVIGAGNMGQALIHGLIQADFPASKLTAADPDDERIQALAQRYGIHITDNNPLAAAQSDLLVLAVKPQQMQAVLVELRPRVIQRQPVILSMAAGIRINFIKHQLSQELSVIRCMPNTAALVQAGMSALYASKEVGQEARQLAETVVNAVGKSLWLDNEDQLDAATALSGSGPAYFFYIMESLIQAGHGLGLSVEQARQLCLQTAEGAIQMAIHSEHNLSELRRRVTSPGGTTEAAIEVLQHNRVGSSLTQALVAAHVRSAELAKLFGDTA